MTSGICPHEDADRMALEDVYLEHRTALLRLAWMLTGNRPDAEDVVQNAFVRYGRIASAPDNPGAYLRKMVVNAVHDLARRAARADATARLFNAVEAGPELGEMWDAVQRLPKDQREVLILRYHDDLSHEEIADAIGCPIGTVRSRISRGLARLREVCHD